MARPSNFLILPRFPGAPAVFLLFLFHFGLSTSSCSFLTNSKASVFVCSMSFISSMIWVLQSFACSALHCELTFDRILEEFLSFAPALVFPDLCFDTFIPSRLSLSAALPIWPSWRHKPLLLLLFLLLPCQNTSNIFWPSSLLACWAAC